MSENKKTLTVLPESMKQPKWILWIYLLPQALLLMLNMAAWSISSGEMTADQKEKCAWLLSYELLLLFLMGISYLIHRSKKVSIGWTLALPSLVMHLGYLSTVSAWIGSILPDTVTLWILPPTKVMYHQFALIMPGMFYSAAILSAFDMRLARGKDIGITLGSLIILPAVWYIVLEVFSSFFRGIRIPELMIIIFFVGSMVLVIIAFIRLVIMAYNGVMKTTSGKYAFLAAVGLAAPIGGLLLNISIPFPYNFQHPMVYVLTVLNGIFLLLPSSNDTALGRVSWVLRSITFPFSLFFFVVFLPFLPLSLLAMIACGAGFLILAPTLLFIAQVRYLVEQGADLAKQYGTVKTLTVFLAAALVMPAAYTARAYFDKHALMAGVHAVYSPDLSEDAVNVNPRRVLRALERLNERKSGVFMPFLSDFYSLIVFGDMVLPDRKMKEIYTAFGGGDLSLPDANMDSWGIFGMRSGRGRRRPWQSRRTPPDRNVALMEIDKANVSLEHCDTAELTFRMKNPGSTQAEFVTDIEMPAGVFVSDFWLKVGEERVPGRIFEKKAAEWVYHMIRDTERRDPGLLVYAGSNRLKFSVFPFAANEEREAAITFAFAKGMNPVIKAGSREIRLSGAEAGRPESIYMAGNGQLRSVIIPSSSALPTMQREAYFHLILDRSLNAEVDKAFMKGLVKKLFEQNPDVRRCRLTMANYEHVDYGGMCDTAEVIEQMDNDVLPYRGGLCAERVIKSALLEYAQNIPVNKDGGYMVPVFVVVRGRETMLVQSKGLYHFSGITPDVASYYVTVEGEMLNSVKLGSGVHASEVVTAVTAPEKVRLLKNGNHIAAAHASENSVIHLPADGVGLDVYEGAEKIFRPVEKIIALPEDSLVAKGCMLRRRCMETEFMPPSKNAALPGIVRLSREDGILTPLTSYIVVENSAQWKMLEQSEKKSLKADSALNFDEHQESPEPSMLLLLPGMILIWLGFRRRERLSCGARLRP